MVMLTVDLNGMKYYRIKDFAEIVGKTTAALQKLMRVGNVFRRLKYVTYMKHTYIPVSELTEFPFTERGCNAGKDGYYTYPEGVKTWHQIR